MAIRNDDLPGSATERSAPGGDDRSVGELVKHLAEQTAALSRQEARLAQLELQQKAKRAGAGIGLLSAAGTLGLIGLAAALSTIGAALALVLPVWAAIALVALAVFLVAGLLAMAGRRSVQAASPAKPEQTVESVRRDVETVRESAHR